MKDNIYTGDVDSDQDGLTDAVDDDDDNDGILDNRELLFSIFLFFSTNEGRLTFLSTLGIWWRGQYELFLKFQKCNETFPHSARPSNV